MKTNLIRLAAFVSVCIAAAAARASTVHVEIQGSVEYNIFINGPLVAGAVNPGDPVVICFDLNSDMFVDGPSGSCATRGYQLIANSWSMRVGSVDVPLTDPTILNPVIYWVLRNNDPGADGVVLSLDPCGNQQAAPIDLAGASGAPFAVEFLRTFSDGNSPNTVFNSLDVLEDTGYWEFEWMSSYLMAVAGGGGEPLGFVYEWFSITRLPPPEITNQPDAIDICQGSTANFTIEASGATAFQWRKNGNPVADGADITGATTAGAMTDSLSIHHANAFHEGAYDCIVSAGVDASTSIAVTLNVWESCTLGDMNCDTTVTTTDVTGFVQALLSAAPYTACNIHNADMNADGFVDGKDVDPFIRLIIP